MDIKKLIKKNVGLLLYLLLLFTALYFNIEQFLLISFNLLQMVNGLAYISFNSILQFATCDDELPLLGYGDGVKPSLIFYEVCPEKKSFLPTANTCSCALQLPRASNGVPLPDADKLFEFYDMAFANEYFGHT